MSQFTTCYSYFTATMNRTFLRLFVCSLLLPSGQRCYTSQCYNGGTCKEAVYTSDYICQCPTGFSGTHCEINTNEKCAVGRGEGYRGTWSISHSGAECINWNSTTLRGRRFTARKTDASSLGLGNHNFCRNPDNDSTPWCFVYKGTQDHLGVLLCSQMS
ncbi:hypothetical protein fugu_003770 [Takifugu bimaculatus]|uniref:Uncharacterized protein n=1 Tax=Takifugu bimaculatus TaxID=433685 RepID=A0A4Z2BDJ8_9TELE|nr:hypothetical protein fugu_003770 [Takifugu bimaculatus]